MVTTKKKRFIFIALFALFMFAGMASYISYHENSHQQIFTSYGITSTIKYIDLNHINLVDITATTTPTNNVVCDDNCRNNQNFAEVIGYHSIAILLNLWMIFTLLIMFVWLML